MATEMEYLGSSIQEWNKSMQILPGPIGHPILSYKAVTTYLLSDEGSYEPVVRSCKGDRGYLDLGRFVRACTRNLVDRFYWKILHCLLF